MLAQVTLVCLLCMGSIASGQFPGSDLECPPEVNQRRDEVIQQLKDLTKQLETIVSQCKPPGRPQPKPPGKPQPPQPPGRPQPPQPPPQRPDNKPPRRPGSSTDVTEDTTVVTKKTTTCKSTPKGKQCTTVTSVPGSTTVTTTIDDVSNEEWTIPEEPTDDNGKPTPGIFDESTTVITKTTCRGSRCVKVENKGGSVSVTTTDGGRPVDVTEMVDEIEEVTTDTTTTTNRGSRRPSPGGQKPQPPSGKVTTQRRSVKRTCRYEGGSAICSVVTDDNGKVTVRVTRDGSPIEEWEIVEEVTEESFLSDTTDTSKPKKIGTCKGDKCIELVRSGGKVNISVKRNNEVIIEEVITEKSSTQSKDTITDSGSGTDETLDVLTDSNSKTSVTNTVTRRRCIRSKGSEVCRVSTVVNGKETSVVVTRDGQETDEDWESIITSSDTSDDSGNGSVGGDVIIKTVSVITTCTRKAGSSTPVCVESSNDNGKVTVVTKKNGQILDRKSLQEDAARAKRMRDKTSVTKTVTNVGPVNRASKRMKCQTDYDGKETCEEVQTDFSGKSTKTVRVKEKVAVDA